MQTFVCQDIPDFCKNSFFKRARVKFNIAALIDKNVVPGIAGGNVAGCLRIFENLGDGSVGIEKRGNAYICINAESLPADAELVGVDDFL